MTDRHQCSQSPARLSAAMREWYATHTGVLLLAEIKRRLDQALPEMFGYHAVLAGGVAAPMDLLDGSLIKHRLCVDADPAVADVVAETDALPFDADCIDVLVLMHALEFAADPHRVLREAERVLIPEGRLIIVGFNPVSFYGLWRLLLRGRDRAPWCGRFYPAVRLKDWLSLLGFVTERCDFLGFRPPLQRPRLLQRLAFLEPVGGRMLPFFGGACLLIARKQVSTLTPLKPSWKQRSGLVPGKLAEPSARHIHGGIEHR
jgi:SAM-dependent methyltransferase